MRPSQCCKPINLLKKQSSFWIYCYSTVQPKERKSSRTKFCIKLVVWYMYTVDSQFFEPSIFSNLPTTLTKSRFPPISRTINFTIDFFQTKVRFPWRFKKVPVRLCRTLQQLWKSIVHYRGLKQIYDV